MGIVNLAGKWPNVAINPATGKTYESEHIDNGVFVQMCPNDTREQLEADVERMVKEHSLYWLHTYIIEWLDRQAVITEREFWEGYANGNQWEIHQLEKKCDELQNEIEYLRKVCKTQADSFAAIENENAALRSKLNRIRELAERLQDA